MKEPEHAPNISQAAAIFVCEIPGNRILEANNQAQKLYGFNRDEFRKFTLNDLINIEDTLSDSLPFKAPNGSARVIHKGGEVSPVKIEETEIKLGKEKYNLVQILPYASSEENPLESSEEIHFHFQNNPLGYMAFNGDFRLLSVSEKITKWLGYENEEIVGSHVEELIQRLIPQKKQKEALAQIKKIESEQLKRSKLLSRVFDKKGEAVYVKFYSSAQFHSDGKLKSVYLFVKNLSEKMHFEQSIQLATDSGDVGFWSIYPKEERVKFNEQWLNRSLGFDEGEVDYSFEKWCELIHPEDFDVLVKDTEKLLTQEIPYLENEFRMKTKQGSWKWFLSRAKVSEFDSEGNPSKLSGIHLNIDDKKRTQLALAEERDKFKLITENSTDMISRHSPDGTYLYVSPSSKQLTGYSPDELIGKSAFDTIHPDDLIILEKNHKKFLESEEPDSVVYRKLTKEGRYKWVETISKTIRNPENGKVMEIQASTRDITERELLNQKLREERKFTNTVIESLPGIFYMIDEEQQFVLWNRNLEEVLECDTEYIRNAHPLDFYRPEDHDFILSKISEAMDTGQASAEIDLLTQKGNIYRYFITGKKIEIGGRAYILGTGIDVSEKEQTLRILHRNDKLLNQLFDNAPVSIVTIDQQQNILNINKSFERTFRYSPDEAIGAHIDDLIVPDEMEINQEEIIIKQDSSDKAALQFETVRLDKNGKQIPVLVGSIPVYIDEELIASYIIYADISDRKQYEKQIEKSLEEKNVLLQEIHHRVKNNLAIISGLISLQKFNLENENLQQILTDCELRIKSIALIHEKLYGTSSFAQVDFSKYAQDLLSSVQHAMDKENDVKIQVDCNSVQLNINQAIPSALILNELLSNAFKYAFDGIRDKKIWVNIEEDDNRIYFSVKDNGVGISPDFDPATSSSLGYSIINTLMAQLEAEFTISSDNGTEINYSFEKKHISGSSGNLISKK